MKQVLLSSISQRISPVVLWMPDDTVQGDTFVWRGEVYQVTAVYTTRMSSCGTECRRTEFPRSHRTYGVILDQRGHESTGAPGAGSPLN